MSKPILFLCLVLLYSLETKSQKIDYYWRDYYGLVPIDAFPAGTDINGNDTYIGQVYLHRFGLLVAQIFSGQKFVDVPFHGITRADSDIKILCTKHKTNFSWWASNSTTFHEVAQNKHLVVGGRIYSDVATVNVGRVMHEGILKIGSLPNRQLVYMYYAHKDQEEVVDAYEVLAYKPSD